MPRKYAIRDQEKYHFVTFTVVHWVDVFTKPVYTNIFIDSVKYCQQHKGLMAGAWCIMSNHVHMIIATSGENKLQDIIRDLKSFTSRQIRKHIEKNQESRRQWMLEIFKKAGTEKSNNIDWQFWQQHNHPIELDTNDIMDQKMEYIHNNPVKAGFVDEPHHWLNSSATDYCGEKGLIEIEFLD